MHSVPVVYSAVRDEIPHGAPKTSAQGWTHNEDGPVCSCGAKTIVKDLGDEVVLFCFTHTPKAAAIWDLPADKPDNWPNLSHAEMNELVTVMR